ncbi:MAG: penicillin-binding transpeptidase domain-containing protein, partial [Oscillospiraceae bacterium]
KILKRLQNEKSSYEIVKKNIEKEEEEALRKFMSDNHLSNAVLLLPDTKRYYPRSTLASHVIGFVNDNGGAYGIESWQEQLLAGTAGRVVTAKNGAGTELLYRYEDYVDAVNGYDLHLSIDDTIQAMAERTLAEGIEMYDVRKGGFCIVMDPKTGAVKAMASSPNCDLNHYGTIADPQTAELLQKMEEDGGISEEDYLKALGAAQNAQWRNKALNDAYEPGSTFKTMVLAAALEEGVVTLNDTFYCAGHVKVANWDISCSKREGHGSQTLTQAVMNSCNPAFIAIGQKLGAEKFYDYLEDYGLIGTTGIDLPGEADNTNLVWSRDYFTSPEGIASLATASFGQTLKVTPIQLITSAAAVLNGGHLMEPYVVQSVTDGEGNVVEEHRPVEVRQVISEQTSKTVSNILEQVVAGGTGKNAYQAGYRIGGKTGTSEKRDEKTGDNIVSFLGFAPADDPQVIVLLAYDSPTPISPGSTYTKDYYYISGGVMGASRCGPLIADVLDYMGVPKQYTGAELGGADVITPKATGLTVPEAEKLLKDRGLSSRTVGEGDTVTGQVPAQGASVPGGSQVILYRGTDVPTETVTVPNLAGNGPTAVKEKLASLGLFVRATGSAQFYTNATVAVTQSISAGTAVAPGTVIDVQFVDNVNDYARN